MTRTCVVSSATMIRVLHLRAHRELPVEYEGRSHETSTGASGASPGFVAFSYAANAPRRVRFSSSKKKTRRPSPRRAAETAARGRAARRGAAPSSARPCGRTACLKRAPPATLAPTARRSSKARRSKSDAGAPPPSPRRATLPARSNRARLCPRPTRHPSRRGHPRKPTCLAPPPPPRAATRRRARPARRARGDVDGGNRRRRRLLFSRFVFVRERCVEAHRDRGARHGVAELERRGASLFRDGIERLRRRLFRDGREVPARVVDAQRLGRRRGRVHQILQRDRRRRDGVLRLASASVFVVRF